MRRLVLPGAVLGIALLAGTAVLAAPAPQAGDLSLDVTAGFDSYYEDGQWVPLRVEVSNSGPDLNGVLRAIDDSSFGSQIIFSRPIDLPSGSRKEVYLYFANNGFVSALDVELIAGNRRLAAESVTLRQVGSNDVLYGLMSDNPSAYSELGLVTSASGNADVALLTVEDLPPVAEAWRALDVLVVGDLDTGQLTTGQRDAMRSWVTSGGRLIVTGGPGWQRTAAGLDPLLPLDVTGTAELDSLAALSEVMSFPAPPFQGQTIVATGDPRPGAHISASQDGLPLWVWTEIGQGRVDFLAADPALEPLLSSPDMETLWRALLAEGITRPGWSNGFNLNWYYAREAVASIPGVSLPSAIQLCGFLMLYAGIVGPLNYFVLRRMKRTELAWLTVPVIVLFFSGCAYFTGYQVRGSRAILHRLVMVQSWPDSDVAKVDGIVGLWSPRRAAYDVEVSDQYLIQPLPGDVSTGLGVAADRLIEQEQGSVVRDVRVDVGAVQSFLVEGYAPASHVESDIRMTLDSFGAMSVTGEVVNTSGIDLEDAVLLAAGAAQHLGELPDGARASVNVSLLTGFASAAPGGGIQLLPGRAIAPPSTYGGFDTTVEDIMGTSYCYGSPDVERRCNLLRASIDEYSGGGRGAGVYLVGWADQSPLDVDVLEASSSSVDTAVYFFALPVQVEQAGQQVTVPPSLMTWALLDSGQGYDYSPYDLYLSPTMEAPIDFRYEPLSIVSVDEFTGLTVHLEGYQAPNEDPPNVSLWDWIQGDWEPVDIDYGATEIEQAARYVNAAGAVHLRIWIDDNAQGMSVDRIDVTLEGNPST